MQNYFIQIIRILKYRFNLEDGRATDEEVITNVRKGVEFKGINLWTLIFAIFIASIGLNVNSTAVIIGAMLISPLMGPIMGVGLGAAIFDFELIKAAAKNLLISSVIGLTTSTIYFLISPLHGAQSELLARTFPTIWDVLIAFFGGLAGIVASSRKSYNNVIPGVAIATALMPPLCTAGYGIATAQWQFFFGAFYLFTINSVFISIATFIVVRALKFHSVSFVDSKTENKVKRFVVTIAILTILPSIYLAYSFVTNEIFKQRAEDFINKEIVQSGITILNKEIIPEKNTVSILILGADNLDSINHELDLKKLGYSLHDAKFFLKNKQIGSKNNDVNVQELKEGIIENIIVRQEEEIKKKNAEIEMLQNIKNKSEKFFENKQEFFDEFSSLFGKPSDFIMEKTIVLKDSINDTILFVYIKPEHRLTTKDQSQIETWLKTKFRSDSIKLIFN
ncbi:MAG: DUF389 domain-containing protein [Bacteroidia bacterium]